MCESNSVRQRILVHCESIALTTPSCPMTQRQIRGAKVGWTSRPEQQERVALLHCTWGLAWQLPRPEVSIIPAKAEPRRLQTFRASVPLTPGCHVDFAPPDDKMFRLKQGTTRRLHAAANAHLAGALRKRDCAVRSRQLGPSWTTIKPRCSCPQLVAKQRPARLCKESH